MTNWPHQRATCLAGGGHAALGRVAIAGACARTVGRELWLGAGAPPGRGLEALH